MFHDPDHEDFYDDEFDDEDHPFDDEDDRRDVMMDDDITSDAFRIILDDGQNEDYTEW